MRAIVVEQGELVSCALPDPEPGRGELLVRVHAAGLNRADLAVREGAGRIKGHVPRATAGAEFAGEIVGIGREVQGFSVGQRVMGMGPGYAELVVVDHRAVLLAPDSMSWQEAAAVPVAALTAHDALVTNGQMAWGESVLINAASSGVGVIALQIAHILGAGQLIAVSRERDKLDRLAASDIPFDVGLTEAALGEQLRDRIDLTLDHVGSKSLRMLIDAAAVEGRIISVGRLGGNVAEINVDELARKRIQLIGVTFRTRTADQRADVVRRFRRHLWRALADGRIRPRIEKVYPLAEAEQAQSDLAKNDHLGKLVLDVA